ncbi:16S rRNA (uracil(1498)-N(3))-methyltransferase [Consotaella salsifontis]|uniref:Ribosomal RNA small subunit methyltransferase E n=1 Tax=Consotaella salsifontis TaxID=1365950 RepID=A0A1T4PZX4_9HYPH|nr:16S rRNA (uracil(1498)-N(3))-methyltransferase [Consotaella salsifontis]SJZ97064.1 16S rRNA (uracil1498-N3)-methyltransferase [Consotaella salsifontis]
MPDYDFRSPRLYVDGTLEAGGRLGATADQINYLINVMRLGDGDTVLLFNGRDGEWSARLERAGKRDLALVAEHRTRPQTISPDLVYLFAPLKRARLDYMVQKAVEMGASVLQPVMTQHVQAPHINIERMRANAIEAAEQCGILTIPECRPMVRLSDCLADWQDGRRLIFCDEKADSASPIEALRQIKPGPLAVLIGPEGGFSQAERELIAGHPDATPISLGPRILRADTAAVAALAVVQAAVGDWAHMPTPPPRPS